MHSRTDLKPFCRRLGTTLVLVFVATATLAATYRVGAGGPPCTHPNLTDAILAAAFNPGPDEIWLARDVTYEGNYLIETPMRIRGGFDSCADNTASGYTSVTRPFDERVFTIQSSAGLVTLQDLRLHYDPLSTAVLAEGGVIHLSGAVNTLILRNTSVSNGRAADGGGIFVEDARLILTDSSVVANNRASFNGGGIYCGAVGRVDIQDGAVAVNEAGYGAGVFLGNGCDGYAWGATGGGLYQNMASEQGGGLFLGAGSEFQLLEAANQPGLIADNTAREGAGVYAIGSGAFFEAVASHIVRNVATEKGGGAFVASDAIFTVSRSLSATCADERCSLLSDNRITSMTSGVGGAALAVLDAFALIYQTSIDGNLAPDSQGAILLEANSDLYLEGNMIYDNSSGLGGIVVAYADTYLQVAHTTVGANSGRPFLSNSGDNVTAEVFSSAFFGHPWGGGLTGSMLFDCSIAPSFLTINGLWTIQGSIEADPLFVNPVAGDYHLGPGSPAIDHCDTALYTPQVPDIDGEIRGFDAPEPNVFGPFDLGADEVVEHPLFADGFESGDTAAWVVP